MRLGIVATHPIQYHVPWFRALAAREGVEPTVYFGLIPDAERQGVGFDVAFEWDVPLLEGYDWRALPNAASDPSLDGFFASRTPAIGRILREDAPDAVILTGWHAWPMLQALGACRRLGIPVLLRGESNAMKPRPAWVRWLHRRLFSRIDAFLAIGTANRELYLRSGVDPGRIVDAPYFVDNAWFADRADTLRPERGRLRQEWGIGPGETCFLFAGKMVEKKRPLDLLRAVDRARERDPGVRALVVGAGRLLDPARRLAADRGLPVAFAGFLNQSEMPRAYVAADCLVLPSDYGETWGLVVNEAMATGLPAIVSDRVGCGPDLVEDGRTGRVVPFGDPEALAGALLEASADPDRRDAMGRAARERVAGFSAERTVEATLEAADIARAPVSVGA